MQLLFWRQRLRWIEHYVLFALGHNFVVQTVLTPLALLISPSAVAVLGLVPILWLGWSARGVMGTGRLSSLGRALIAFVVIQGFTAGLLWLVMPDLLQPSP